MTKIFDVIRKPLLTEKGQILREQNIQVFEVATWATKHQIKEAVDSQPDQAPGPLRGHFQPPQEGLCRTRRGHSHGRVATTHPSWRTEKLCPLSPAPFNPEARGQS